MMRESLLLLCWLLAGSSLSGQTVPDQFKILTSESGLTENHVNAIYQDPDGFIWIGTFDGLNRYDGYRITDFKPTEDEENSLSSILIYAITGDRNGNLWIGTTGGGLSFYDGTTESFLTFRADASRATTINSDFIQTAFVDRKNRLWVGTDRGINMLDLSSWERGTEPVFEHFQDAEGPRVYDIQSIMDDDLGNVWLGSNSGLYQLRERQGKVSVSAVRRTENSLFSTVSALDRLADGRLVIGGASGLHLQDVVGSDVRFEELSPNPVAAVTVDSTGQHIWAGTQSGLQLYQRTGRTFAFEKSFLNNPADPNSLSNNTIDELYTDADGLVWIGTFGGGVNRFDPYRKRFGLLKAADGPEGLSSNSVRAILQDSERRLWIGTVGGGINIVQPPLGLDSVSEIRRFEGPARVYSIMEVNDDRGRYMYFGTDVGPGLYRSDLRTAGQEAVPVRGVDRSVFSMIRDSRGILWFGSYSGGVYRWIPDEREPDGYRTDQFQHVPGEPGLPSSIVRSVVEDRVGNIWIGTAEGLARLPADEATATTPNFDIYRQEAGNEASLSHNYVLSLLVGSDNTLWVGTFGGGLNQLMRGNNRGEVAFRRFTEREGFPNGVVKAMLEDDRGNIWASTNKGIVRHSPTDGDLVVYDYGDGLQSNEFQELAACRQDDGTLVFGGVNGINYFHPDDIADNETSVRPVLTALEVLNVPVVSGQPVNGRPILTRSLHETEQVTLRHSENSLSLEFSAMQFTSPEDNRYAYMLEGFDEDWIYTDASQRRATYTNLPYRDYTFKVKASNNDGVWSEAIASLGIRVRPPFWLAWYAYVFYALLAVAFLYAYRKFSLIDVEEKNRMELEQRSRDQIRELNQLKLQFFTNISHELRTPLTLITGPLESLLQSARTIQEEEQERYLHLMYKNAKYLLRLVNQLLDFRRLDSGAMPLQVEKKDITRFIREVCSPFEFLANKRKIGFSVVVEEEPLTVWFDPAIVEKVIYNLLSNAFKFTPAGGEVVLRIRKSMGKDSRTPERFVRYGSVAISVEDTGTGIGRKQLKHIFDRFYKSSAGEVGNKEGAGIGLAYTNDLVQLHRGQIDVDSKEGVGTTFTVRLTLDKNHYSREEFRQANSEKYVPELDPEDFINTDQESTEEELEQNALIQAGQKVRQLAEEESPLLLYIDDNADLRDFIRHGMGNDFRVIAADGGRAGIEIATTAVPEIIITDLMMPEVDGMEVLRTLKEDPRTSHIPILMLTAKDTAESEMEGIGSGADGYLTKPFNIGVLTQRVKNILNRRDLLREKFRKEVITSPKEITVTNVDEEFLQRAMDIVEANMGNTDFSVEQLVKEMRVSRSKLYLKLKALTGQSSSEFVRTVRLKRAVQLLENSGHSVKEVMFMTGFNTASYFSKCFKQQFGIVPSEYVKQHRAKAEEVS